VPEEVVVAEEVIHTEIEPAPAPEEVVAEEVKEEIPEPEEVTADETQFANVEE
jgi:hypothetical protein